MFTVSCSKWVKGINCSLPWLSRGTILIALPCLSLCTAHGRRWRRWWPVTGVTGQLPGGLPRHTFYWVQRRPWDLPLLCQQVQLLAHHHPWAKLPRLAVRRHAQGRAHPDAHQPLPGVHEEPVMHLVRRGRPTRMHVNLHLGVHFGAYS